MEQNFNNPQQPNYGYEGVNVTLPPQKQRKTGLAIAALILGILSIIGLCCCCINVITAPLAIIFGIIVLVKHRDGTGLAITGIVLSVLSLLVVVGVFFSIREIIPYADVIASDYTQMLENADEVFTNYEADQSLPDYLEKYTEEPYASFFAKYDITFYDVMDALLVQYKQGTLQNPYGGAVTTSKAAGTEQIDVVPDDVIMLPA